MTRDLRPDGTLVLTAADIDAAAQRHVEGRDTSLVTAVANPAVHSPAARRGHQGKPGTSFTGPGR